MRTLKRSECAVLHLGLRYHWFQMIGNGTKLVEFREAKPYWQTRITNWHRRMNEYSTPPFLKTPVLEFQCGYGRFSPRMWFIAGRGMGTLYEYLGENVPVQHKELGEFPKARYALFIGERINLED